MEKIAIDNVATMDASGNNKASGYHYTKIKNERTAGFIPSYSPSDQDSFNTVLSSFTPEQSLEQSKDRVFVSKEDHFGFFDLIDMINPLQHIPVLNIAYQKLTGDTIKPISRIIGGTIFGGPAGAASGLVTAVIEEGTGKSALANAVSLASGNNDDAKAYSELPPELLSFAQLPSVNDQNYSYNT